MRELLLDLSEDDRHRKHRGIMLSNGDASMTSSLMEALRSPDIRLEAGVCEDDTSEICIRATGTTFTGRPWHDVIVMMFDPEWDRDAELSMALADDVVTLRDSLAAIAVRETA